MKKVRFTHILSAILLVSLGFSCQNPSSSGGDKKNEGPQALTQNFTYQNLIEGAVPHIFGALSVDGGIVAFGSYQEKSDACGEYLYLLKLDGNGNEVWLKKYRSLPKISSCNKGSINPTQDGGFLISATIENDYSSDNSFDLFVSKLTSTGDVEWSKTLDYSNYDWHVTGFQHANGNFILYPTIEVSQNRVSNMRVTIDQSGDVISEESHSDFDGTLYLDGIDVTKSGNVIFRSFKSEQGTIIKVMDNSLNPIANTHSKDGLGSFYQSVNSQNGYFTLDGGRLVKYNAQLEKDWEYKPEIRINAWSNPVAFTNNRYGVLEAGRPNPTNNNPRIVLTIVEEGGGITTQGFLQEKARHIIRKVITDANDNIYILSRQKGVMVESYATNN